MSCALMDFLYTVPNGVNLFFKNELFFQFTTTVYCKCVNKAYFSLLELLF